MKRIFLSIFLAMLSSVASMPAQSEVSSGVQARFDGDKLQVHFVVPRGNSIFLGYKSSFWSDYYQIAELKLADDLPVQALDINFDMLVTAKHDSIAFSYNLLPVIPNGLVLLGVTEMRGHPVVQAVTSPPASLVPSVSKHDFAPNEINQLAQWVVTYQDGRKADSISLDAWIGTDVQTLASKVRYSLNQGKRPPVVTFDNTIDYVHPTPD